MAAPKRKRRKKHAPKSRGFSPQEVKGKEPTRAAADLGRLIVEDGGEILAYYQDPLGGHSQILAVVPLEKVKPTSFQRDLSEAHVKRLRDKIEKLDRYLDPITVVRSSEGEYLTPNGHHRTAAMTALGAKSIIAMVIPDFEIAYQILALNTEKAYNLREKSYEAIRLARQLSEWEKGAKESDYAEQFEEPAFLTLGACYEKKGNFSGGAYQSVLKKTESFLDEKMNEALKTRAEHAKRLLDLDFKVAKMVDKLKEKGLKSPYLKTFVVARINPLRFSKEKSPDFDKTLDKMEAGLEKMNPEKIEMRHLASLAGAPVEAES